MFNQRKGITPVIAIVLLLLITVGAVGVVYTQFQGLVEGGNGGEDLNRIQAADYSIVAATDQGSSDNTVLLRIRNTGDAVYNLSESASLEVSQGGSYVDIDSAPGAWTGGDDDLDCLDQSNVPNNGRLQTGDDYECDSTISFPSPGDTPWEFRLSVDGTVMDTRSCSVQRSGAVVC